MKQKKLAALQERRSVSRSERSSLGGVKDPVQLTNQAAKASPTRQEVKKPIEVKEPIVEEKKAAEEAQPASSPVG